MSYKYPLQVYPWTFMDRLKAATFILNSRNRLTIGPQTKNLEKQFELFCNNTVNCVATSSGSTANSLMLEVAIQVEKFNVQNTIFFCCSTSWASNVTPMIMRGYKVQFVDINLYDFSFDYEKLETELKNSRIKNKVIWTTCLIGFSPDVDRLRYLANKYNAFLFADVCEAAGTYYKSKPLLSCFSMATTSTFLAHISSSIEGGILFIDKNRHDYYIHALMIRNHGLTRGLSADSAYRKKAEEDNPDIDPEFLFQVIGTNYRISDLHSYFGLLDLARFPKYIKHRQTVWQYFINKLNPSKFRREFSKDVTAFCLPIFLNEENLSEISDIKKILNNYGWETRPVISFLPLCPPFRFLSVEKNYPNSEILHNRAAYVGLSNNLTKQDIDGLISILN